MTYICLPQADSSKYVGIQLTSASACATVEARIDENCISYSRGNMAVYSLNH